ncbi:hypothetical protein [Microtetraspora niveoalba]|uniref:hypothetical protein n=1 Tax=Microtetraspora niveoalba TaxID=46175 RepID=UPI0008298B44|nr:hypothetical protein [Microtetraspora niveoalba]
MTNAWDEVRAAIDAEDAAAVAALVAGFDEERRREVARELPGHLPVAREAGRRRDEEREREWRARWLELDRRAERSGRSVHWFPEVHGLYATRVDSLWMEPMRVAGAGTIAGAAAVVTWLNKRDLTRFWEPDEIDDTAPILQVVAARPAAWQRDLAVRMALRLRAARRPEPDRRVRLTLELLRRTGAEPPEHDPLTLAWIAASTPGELAGDPLLDAMTPRLFEAEGVGRLLRADREWPAALAGLADSGRIRRAALLDGCRARFLRGGEAVDQRFFVRLYELLDPAPDEVAPHTGDYLALLASAPANVAGLALKQVRRAGPVPPERAGEAVEGLLFRGEGRLVRAGLAWLDRLLKDPAGDLDAYAPALAAALVCESGDARDRAVKLAVKHAPRFGPPGAETIREVVALLPAGQGAELAEVFGGEPAPQPEPAPECARFVPVPLPDVPPPAPMPPRVEAPETLVRLSLQLSEFDWMSSERWLDGFVRLAAGCPDGPERARLAAALAPLAARCPDRRFRWRPWWGTGDWAAAMARELAEPGAERRAHPEGRLTVAERVPGMTHAGLGKLMPLFRYAEVYEALVEGTLPPYLLGTPTRANGLLDAETLVERLEGYERDGVAALPLDLRQALLRLGRTVTDEVAERAARLNGEAGRTVARWLTDRPEEPRVVLTWGTYEGDTRITSEFVSGPEYREVLGDLLVPRMHDESCGRLLAVLAGHRELAAARSAYTLRTYWPLNKPSAEDLRLLVSADGPAGPGLCLLLAQFLLEGPDGEAVLPLLHLAAAGDLPGEELGRRLADLLARDGDGPGEVVAALRAAAERGAHREVWQVMRGLLPACLPGPDGRATTTHTRLMRFAADAAEWAGARGELAVVARIAARTRGSELVRQARRLHDLLTAEAPTKVGGRS